MVFFRAETLGGAIDYLSAMFSFSFFNVPFELVNAINPEVVIALVAGMILSFPGFFKPIGNGEALNNGTKTVVIDGLRFSFLFCLLFLSAMQLAASTHNPFIYFRFRREGSSINFSPACCMPFIAALAVPLVVGLVQTDLQTSEQEKRSLAQWPTGMKEKI